MNKAIIRALTPHGVNTIKNTFLDDAKVNFVMRKIFAKNWNKQILLDDPLTVCFELKNKALAGYISADLMSAELTKSLISNGAEKNDFLIEVD